ncbi:lysophospholipase [Erwinia sp. OLTSP20]|uniref:lysophospholipase L2 n=1 Tax=unclassified Erwinia TaxID=2622719 RepID=UPI000C1967F4|nr:MULTISPECIES: lysophospholipase L2 [unclassified Erwinia]PIJ50793.1 lysophospholipase [Erwinia sp. OAMSP11]PIJ72945.1 lysophospholipase [Erwinia sp. OLSSP12]PIJ81960.1 lysophospholipase [Erwinia sp. OLCASP19]PIJ84615.1 lysophospholipase [Erwinia sp. OLMTSP26]PIJ86962.1 lysophospholipase [Erwinia sp. OLMDSP33]
MINHKQTWPEREKAFAAFVNGPLLDFWQGREELQFSGVGGVPIHYVRFISAQHQRVILLCPGRNESYVKYPELAYDLFHCGYDVVIIDHRGQGRSGRLLDDTQRGHVESFSDYVDDLDRLWQREIAHPHYQRRFALAHSMGGAITTLLMMRRPDAFDAAALVAPMFGIFLPLPRWLALPILAWAEKHPVLSQTYALGTGRWRPQPFGPNDLTHSLERYRRNLRFYADEPQLRVGGPTHHWVREGIQAGEDILRHVSSLKTPLLLLQAEDEKVVDNQAQNKFCHMLNKAGNPCVGNAPLIIRGAYHEILFESDGMRAQALNAITAFFDRFH